MELALPRNHKGKGWELDKARRWRSKVWRHWVRTLEPVRHPANIDAGLNIVIAAHFRYPGCGMGARPADCFVYPMHDSDHKDAHGFGQPEPAEQWQWVTGTMISGLQWGIIHASTSARNWIEALHEAATERDFDLSAPSIEAVAGQWAHYFVSGGMKIHTGGM